MENRILQLCWERIKKTTGFLMRNNRRNYYRIVSSPEQDAAHNSLTPKDPCTVLGERTLYLHHSTTTKRDVYLYTQKFFGLSNQEMAQYFGPEQSEGE